MKVKCQYCNSFFNLDKNLKCPVCGGEISQKDIDEYQEIQKKRESINISQKELDVRKKKYKFEEKIKQEKTRKKIVSTYLKILFVIFIGLPILSAAIEVTSEMITQYEEIAEEQNKPVDVATTVSFNEKAQMVNYSIICDKVENWVYDQKDFTQSMALPKPGYKHVRFHFILENTSDERLYNYEDVFTVSSEGYQCDKVLYLTDEANAHKWKSTLDLAPGLKKEGYIYRIFPENATEANIQYDGLVTINVPLP